MWSYTLGPLFGGVLAGVLYRFCHFPMTHMAKTGASGVGGGDHHDDDHHDNYAQDSHD